MNCLEFSAFDAEAFGHPFYRVKAFDFDCLRADIAELPAGVPVAIDAKVPAPQLAAAGTLSSLGFRKVSMQIRLARTASTAPSPSLPISIADTLDLAEDLRWQHARNFRLDRFHADPLLAREGCDRIMFRWVSNSLSGRARVAFSGPNFCTFKVKSDGWVEIDLMTVLEPRKGIGAALLAAIAGEASRLNAPGVLVTTECENEPAWKLYVKSGFTPVEFTHAMHLVKRP